MGMMVQASLRKARKCEDSMLQFKQMRLKKIQWKVLVSIVTLGLSLSLVGCGGGGGGDNGGSMPLTSVPLGVFGGKNSELTVTAAGGTLKLSCNSSASITSPLTLDSSGSFTASGTYVPISGGSVPVGSPPRSFAAQFTGTSNGTTVNLTVTPVASSTLPATTYVVTSGTAATFTAPCPL